MKTEYIKATRAQLIANMKAGDISRRTDTMEVCQRYQYFSLDEAKKAAGSADYKRPGTLLDCRVYVTNRSGTYGHQFLAAIWVHVDGERYQASGTMTGGCGYDKISTAVGSAFGALGLDSSLVGYFSGTGQHEQVLDELAAKLAGRKSWFKV